MNWLRPILSNWAVCGYNTAATKPLLDPLIPQDAVDLAERNTHYLGF